MRCSLTVFLCLLVVLLTGCGVEQASNSSTNTSTNTNANAALPEFPWPPNSSAFTSIPSQMLVKGDAPAKLGDVDARLRAALNQGGYENPGYYSIDGGFVMVTNMEQFDINTGAPLTGANRWSTTPVRPRAFTLEYLRTLIKGTSGHFRVIAFAVTNKPFTRSGKVVSGAEAAGLSMAGANKLPSEMAAQAYTEEYQCSAFVYEFLQSNSGPKFVTNSGLLANQHLQKIMPHLQQRL